MIADDGQSQTGSKRGSSASKKRGPKAVAAVAIEEKSVKPTAKKEPESKSKRRRTAKSVKQESEDVLEAAALEIKSEVGFNKLKNCSTGVQCK